MSFSNVEQNHIDNNKVVYCEKDEVQSQENCEDSTINTCTENTTHLTLDGGDTEINKQCDDKCNVSSTENVNYIVNSNLIEKPIDVVRRNSLPETALSELNKEFTIKSTVHASSSNINETEFDDLKPPTLHSERIKVAPNITEVVKNVHGLFSSIKNVYREKHIGEMIQATQKNLVSAKNGYLNIQKEMFSESKPQSQKDILESLNKYSNLNMSSEEQQLESLAAKSNDVCEANQQCESAESPCKSSSEHSLVNPYSDEDTIRLSTLQIVVQEQSKQIDNLKNMLMQKDKSNRDLETKCTEMSKQLEASVMRYAMSERQILSAEKTCSGAVEREGRAREEVGLLERKLKSAHIEKLRICDMLDEKSHELSSVQKEVGKLKEELYMLETKLKWTQNRLTSEMEAHKEASALAERLGKQEGGSGNNTGAQTTPQHTVTTLTDSQIKEIEASNILERHEKERLNEKCKALQKELDGVKAALKTSAHNCEELKAQAESNAGEAAALRDICNELRIQAAKDCERLAATQARAARLDTTLGHLQQEQEKCAKLQEELETERKLKSSAQAEAELSTRREAELLRQVERLTEAGVRLQAVCSEAEAKALALSVDNASLRKAAEREAERVALARSEVERERRGREEDARALAATVAKHQRAERLATQKVEQLEGDLRVMATKHSSTVKELKREIQRWKKKCERSDVEHHYEANSKRAPAQRSGSCSSLSSFEGSVTQHSNDDATVDRQHLVEKIVDLQKAGAHCSERVEFLEEHNSQLTAELKKKSRLLRSLMASMPAGALVAPASDRAKVEIGKHGGIMASLFMHEVSDNTMSLELSLEITAKLQAVLEDTLLKNITLKENMDTLGDEITLLKEELKKRPKK